MLRLGVSVAGTGVHLESSTSKQSAREEASRCRKIIESSAKPPRPLTGVLNAGFSCLKFALYEDGHRMLSGQVHEIGVRPTAKAFDANGEEL